ncbi:prepilin-type N-terminal cleavage/methylation domain-containing protein [Clostridium estertheticum]|uniref:Prepilin-type N-terminal cleavage/methylation domain-containing protein n=1 Tax=Clostridium estertheticum TaxID=238834 RepID=A0A5N7J2X7_9CLOT|nr:prepilin-type N-terminal cleavage/methylation domain-containing protein [Clostridium estertheticum]MPQ32409.1 prepilin-type N-terminal cleavage/methylation domain-containing protein [Clostridium estertheticum]MPQ63068.1 prepilin-type N-terminal cleavage/methylation domain-containing protein [Clostridium estertheticum]
MSKSLSKKGFTLVEVLCSLGVFSIIFICMMSFDKASINMKKDIKNINKDVLIMEAIKNNIIYSMTFKELQQLEISKSFFVNKENMDFDKIKANVKQVFSDHTPTQNPYIELSLIKDELNVYKLKLLLHSGQTNKREELQCNFYKGCHE